MLLLWGGVVSLWIRSYFSGDQVVFETQKRIPQPYPYRDKNRHREFIAQTGRGGICLAMRVTEDRSSRNARDNHRQISPYPTYPQPWAPGIVATFTAPLKPASKQLVLGPSTAPFSVAPNVATLNFASGAFSLGPTTQPVSPLVTGSIDFSGNTVVNVSPARMESNNGSLTTLSAGAPNVSAGTKGMTAVTTIGRGTLRGVTVRFSNASTIVPLPPPEHPPGAPYHFLAYAAGDPSKSLGRAHVFIFPFWLLLLMATVPTFFVVRWELRGQRRRWRRKRGFCECCGYDLRMTPDCCPECGSTGTSALNRV
jgi:hypothetical protein